MVILFFFLSDLEFWSCMMNSRAKASLLYVMYVYVDKSSFLLEAKLQHWRQHVDMSCLWLTKSYLWANIHSWSLLLNILTLVIHHIYVWLHLLLWSKLCSGITAGSVLRNIQGSAFSFTISDPCLKLPFQWFLII